MFNEGSWFAENKGKGISYSEEGVHNSRTWVGCQDVAIEKHGIEALNKTDRYKCEI